MRIVRGIRCGWNPLSVPIAAKDKYPLHLQSCHPDKRLHSQLCSSEAFRNTYAVAGREPLYISEQDATARGLKAGDIARVFNARGQVLAGVVVSRIFPRRGPYS